MFAKLFSTLLQTLFWAIPAYVLNPWAGLAIAVLGLVWFFLNPGRVTWLPQQGGVRSRIRQTGRLLEILLYWAVGTAAMSGLAWLIRFAWDHWQSFR
jgi:hypothetical protein